MVIVQCRDLDDWAIGLVRVNLVSLVASGVEFLDESRVRDGVHELHEAT